MRPIPVFLLVLLAIGSCAPVQRPAAAPAEIGADTAARPMVEAAPVPSAAVQAVPVTDSYAAALVRGTRGEDGAPGPDYWQQSVRYEIQAELDPGSRRLRGSERITYANNSPLALERIVLNLYQNVFAEGVRRNRRVALTGGMALERIEVQGRRLGELSPAERRQSDGGVQPGYWVDETLGYAHLPRPVEPGESLVLEIDWSFVVPPETSFRTGWEDALGARAFQVAQWYPQIATFDDVRGWDATPYLGDGEFYLEYGDFDVSITVPQGWLVGATGVLQNPGEVLTGEAATRLAGALRADGTTHIVTGADLTAGNVTQASPDAQLTWHFSARDVRDFAFATSDGYVWDVTRARIGDRWIPVHALYRADAPHWERAAEFGEHATEHLSESVLPYPYPQLTIAEGPIGGMEYPHLIFIGRFSQPEPLYGVIAHEVAHQWFPMLVGSDEATWAWMDEGIGSYLEALARRDFFADPDAFASDLRSYLAVAGTDAEVPLMRHTDLVTPYGARGVAAYTKPSVVLRGLGAVIGDDVLRDAIRTYAREWTNKHPYPWDFFATVERVAGERLGWFFVPWWFETSVFDQAIQDVDLAPDGSARITIADRGEIRAPTRVLATRADGSTAEAAIPVETWLAGSRTATVTLPPGAPVQQVRIDPDAEYPDVNRENDVWKTGG